MKKKYRVKSIVWSKPLLIGGLVYIILLAIFGYFSSGLSGLLLPVVSALVGILIVVLLSLFNSYAIDNEVLIIKLWYGKTKIDIADIKKIKETNLKYCIEIRYKKYKQTTICLKDKDEFINDLKSINPEIEVVHYEKNRKSKKSVSL